ncbi:hypothetical protein ccbrp13_19980 [Ktedonobacteria bacterium brp13]|nr:hypothetical protein ccbrp13_19980 [Ktedonobacteria bacterium brp13]
MSDQAAGNNTASYHPISRKYLRYLLTALNEEDSGGGTFAQLAIHLIHRRKCANIVPATEPSAGGDLGQDGRTQRVILDSDSRFRLYESPPITKERWIFAFSIRADWNAKLKSDAKKIVANDLHPDLIVFVTNQFINPEHIKINAEQNIRQEYGIPCEILDGQWILDQLYEQDYALAVEFLGCPPESDPKLMDMFRRVFGLQEGGLAEEEAVELEQLKSQLQYRNRYIDTPEHLVQDLRRIGNILAPYEAYLEEALRWYEEALPELDRITNLPDGIELLYSYFKALQKLPYWQSKIFHWLPSFIDMIFATQARSIYHYMSVWLNMLFPAMNGQEPFDRLYSATLERLRAIDRTQLGILSIAYLEETILFLEFTLIYKQENEVQYWLQRVHSFLQNISNNGAFPRHHITGALSTLAPRLGDIAEYEMCFEVAIELKSEQEGGFAKANTYKTRALAHAHANQLEDALIMASRAQKLWLNEHAIRGYLLITYTMASWYDQLGYAQAAEYELLQGMNITTWQPAFMESDIFLAMIVASSSSALKQGRILRAYRWLYYYQRICHMYRLKPDDTILKKMIEGNLISFEAHLYTRNRLLHDKLLEIADSIDTDLLLGYQEINLSSDEEFEVWLSSDLTQEQQAECRNMRRHVHNGETHNLEDFVEYDELAQEQYIEWQKILIDDILTFRVCYPRDPRLAQMAFTIAAMTQIWSVFQHRDLTKLTLADNQVDIILGWQAPEHPDPFNIIFNPQGGKLNVDLTLTPGYIKQVANIDPKDFLEFFLTVIMPIMGDITIDPPGEIMALFDPNTYEDGIDHMIMTGNPALLWESTLARTVLGVDDAPGTL